MIAWILKYWLKNSKGKSTRKSDEDQEENLYFGKALEAIKNGKKAKRKGWNGKEQYVVLAYMKQCITSSGVAISEPEHVNIGSKFLMFVGTSGYQCGWLASQADMLADDWEIVE